MDDFLVIGNPIEHSLSPQMQNAALDILSGGKLHYGRRKLELDELEEFSEFARKNLRGFNVTVPFKREIIPFLDTISSEAELAQSVNTVIVKDGMLHGESTDGYGLAMAVKEAFDLDVKKSGFLFLGCGGAVWAAAAYLGGVGTGRIRLVNRTLNSAANLCDILQTAYPELDVDCCSTDENDKIERFVDQCDIAVQGSSLGLKSGDPSIIDYALLHEIKCFDCIYHETPFLKYAREHNLAASDGRNMLLYQGALSLSYWLERQDIPLEVMRKALYDAMKKD